MSRRMRRALVSVIVAVSLALALAACTGDGAARAFDDAFGDDPAVARTELTSADNHSFTGGVSGTVTARDDLDDDTVRGLAERMSAYTAENADTMRGRVDLIADGIRMTVTGVAGDDDRDLDILLALRADERVEAGTVSEGGVHATAPDAESAVALFADLPGLVAVQGGAARDASGSVGVRTEDSAVDLVATSAAEVEALVGVWTTVSTVTPLTGIGLRGDDTLVLRLRDESDLAAAQTVPIAVDGVGAVVFESDIVRIGNESDAASARALLAALTPLPPEVEMVWSRGADAQVIARDTADLLTLIRPLAAARDAVAGVVRLTSLGTPELRVEVPSPADAAVWRDAIERLAADADVTAVVAAQGGLELTTTALSDADVARFAPMLRALTGGASGVEVCVQRPRDRFCVTASDRIDLAEAHRNARDHAGAFVDAWNAAD